MTADRYAYDVFVSAAPADATWVEDELLPFLRDAPLRVATHEDVEDGRLLNDEFTRLIRSSRRTLLVLSPEYLADPWPHIVAVVAHQLEDASGTAPIVPVLLRTCAIPAELRSSGCAFVY